MCVANRSKIAAREYDSVEDICADVLLLYANCELYNEADSVFCKEARRQRRAFQQFVRNDLEQ